MSNSKIWSCQKRNGRQNCLKWSVSGTCWLVVYQEEKKYLGFWKTHSSFPSYSQLGWSQDPPRKLWELLYQNFAYTKPAALLLQMGESMLPQWVRNAEEFEVTGLILRHTCMFEQDDDFDSTTGLLSGSLKRINFMVNSGRGNRKLMCYLILGLVALFFIMFYVISWLRTSWL